MHPILILFAHSCTCQDIPSAAQSYQAALMRIFFSRMYDSFVAEKSRGQCQTTDACEYDICDTPKSERWEGKVCEDGLVTEIHFNSRWMEYAGQLNILHIPPTVSAMRIRYCKQQYMIPTRYLPRGLIEFDMQNNQLEGGIELRALPHRIETVDLKFNYIIGPIDIRFVPKTLRRLDLSQNRLFQDVVYYGEFSPCMEFIDFRGSFVKKVLPERPQYKESARNVEIHF